MFRPFCDISQIGREILKLLYTGNFRGLANDLALWTDYFDC